jgi:hypothetical protein
MPRPITNNDKPAATRAFTPRRIHGTVPIASDGSAYFEAPAMRSLIFVARDAEGRAVKHMQSFVTLMPGEVIGCIGCHERRTDTPSIVPVPLAVRKEPSVPRRAKGVPEIIDFARHIQPVFDRHCVRCHGGGDKRPEGKATLRGHRGIPQGAGFVLHSYQALFSRKQITWDVKGKGNRPPRFMGSASSPLMNKISGDHHKVKLSAQERDLIMHWLDVGAPYFSTAAFVGAGWGQYRWMGKEHPEALSETLKRRCASCHRNIERCRYPGYHIDLSKPEESWILKAPLAKSAGGWEVCRPRPKKRKKNEPPPEEPDKPFTVFADTSDTDYQALLAGIRRLKKRLEEVTTHDMPNFKPHVQYIREMKRYGFLPADFDVNRDPINVHEVDERYWRSFWAPTE